MNIVYHLKLALASSFLVILDILVLFYRIVFIGAAFGADRKLQKSCNPKHCVNISDPISRRSGAIVGMTNRLKSTLWSGIMV